MKTVYKSKVDLWLEAVCYAIILVSTLPTIIKVGKWSLESITVATIMVLLMALISIMLHMCRYEIDGHRLTIRMMGFFTESYNINFLTEIHASHSILSAPAASIDRLELRFTRHRSVLISPKEKDKFIEHILQINPDVKVKL